MNLEELRREINLVDEEILKCFIKRMDISEKIALGKIENNIELVNKTREEEILNKVESESKKYSKYSRKLFITLMDLSKEFQREVIGD
ncbi:Chorismate mutase [Anaerosphaera aminiphila DSM 21120]|uniref:Chorismate mutase n=1 Tax=Anaerosphaera aminiphila DSM 21120 TaxID=1120995 RepID=A0A1M5PS77_9FIRM|nr:chorismate mutase [Anaerosphaera aminiphila]SHH04694.1 Chorismate mutase [Anaerosphaera aminiphila DSM 21120]